MKSQLLPLTALEKFYASSLITLSTVVAVILIAIWLKIQKTKDQESKNEKTVYDYGLIWIACAIFCWTLSGTWLLLKETVIRYSSEELYQGIRSLISTFNNMFLLLSLPYFDHGPEKLNLIQDYHRYTRIIIIFSAVICLLTSILILVGPDKDEIILLPEFFYALITILVMGAALIKTFYIRDFKIIMIFTGISIFIMICSQVPEIWPSLKNNFDEWLFQYLHLVSKVTIMTILLALAMSWVEVVAKRPQSKEMSIRILGIKNNKGQVEITVPPDLVNHRAEFNLTPFEYLLKFLTRRIQYESADEAWLSVKKDIHDCKNIRRIIDEIGCKINASILRTELFDNDHKGHYRIRIAPDNIDINIKELLEFPGYKERLGTLRSVDRLRDQFNK